MLYTVVTQYPKYSEKDSTKETEATKKEKLFDLKAPEVLALYDHFIASGYKVGVSYEAGEAEEKSPFDIAKDLERQGIDYVAKLRFLAKSNTGSYDKIVALCRKIEQHGFYKYKVDIQLKCHEDSIVDIDREATWFDSENTKYKVTADIKSTNISHLKGIYDDLVESKIAVDIDIKPKKDANTDFAMNLAAFPEGTRIKFNLTQ